MTTTDKVEVGGEVAPDPAGDGSGTVVSERDTQAALEARPQLPPRLAKRPFGTGERFTFSIQYGPIKAGTSTLWVESIDQIGDRACYRFSSETRSNGFFNAVFKVRDRVESFLDVGELMTLRSTKNLHQGDFRREESIAWDQEAGTVTYQDGTVAEIPFGARDVLGAFYFIRTMELRVGDKIPLEAHDGKKTYPLWVEVLGKETITTPVGRFDCLIVEPKLQSEGLFKSAGSLKVWLTDDDRHMPVMMQSKIKVGAVSAILVKYERGREEPAREPGVHAN